MNKYVPDGYRTPQPSSYPDPSGGYFPANGVPIPQPQRARGPSVGGAQISSTPPFPNSYPGYSSSYPPQQQQYQPSYPGTPAYTPGPASTGYNPGPWTPNPPYPQAVNELRPPGAEQAPRRRSDASTHSRRSGSHRSHHSGNHSQRSESRRRRRSAEDDYDHEREKERERRHREKAERRASAPEHRHEAGQGHGHHGKKEGKELGRVRTRPTLGDTVYSSFGKIKYWLGPRDKY